MPETHPQALPMGHHIAEYEIVRVLGAGGFGITYLAFDHNLNGPVAIKEYFYAGLATRTSGGAVEPNSTSNGDGFQWGRDRFLDEAQVLSRLDHPNIVRVHRYFEENNTAYIVMDYVEGESLAVFLKAHGSLTPDQWRPWMEALLDGLEHIHGRKYLHRDIKPENIVIRARADGESQPVLIDFGSARRAAADKTRQLTAVHTPGYAPIEQYSTARRQGPATDIYALSAVSYRVLAGAPPPDAADRMIEDEYQPLADRIAGADRAWLAGIDQGLGVLPDARPQTVAAWRAVLENRGKEANSTALSDLTKDDLPLMVNDAATREQKGASADKWPLNLVFLLAAAIVLAAGIAGEWLNAPSTTQETSRVARPTVTRPKDNPAATTLPRQQRPQARGHQDVPGPSAPSYPPSTRVGDSRVNSRRVTGAPIPRESSPRPTATSAPSSTPTARVGDNTVINRRATDPPAPRESSPRLANTSAPNSMPTARVGDNTVVGWRAADPPAPREASPNPATTSAPGSTPTARVGDNTVVGWRAVEPVRVGGDITPPTKTKDVPPVYPPAALSARVQGIVILEAVIGPSGRVTDVKVLRSVPLLDEAAIEAVKQWEYTPTLLAGVPVPVIMTVTVNFTL